MDEFEKDQQPVAVAKAKVISKTAADRSRRSNPKRYPLMVQAVTDPVKSAWLDAALSDPTLSPLLQISFSKCNGVWYISVMNGAVTQSS